MIEILPGYEKAGTIGLTQSWLELKNYCLFGEVIILYKLRLKLKMTMKKQQRTKKQLKKLLRKKNKDQLVVNFLVNG